MGRNVGSKTGIIVQHPMICQQCGAAFFVLGKRKLGSKRPAKFCSAGCYHASRIGRPYVPGALKPGKKRGPPFGRIPWNKGKQCPQLSGIHNGMFAKTHSEEVRRLLSEISSQQLSAYTRKLLNNAVPPLRRSDREYMTLFRIGWRKIRKFVLKRDGFRCAICKARSATLTVHHIKPFCYVLKHDIANLVSLCAKCHTKIHRGLLEFNPKHKPKAYAST